ncbi:MAG: hypothetical protein IJ611_05470 [Bacteroidales bacterium]|nr:hypothetical protein [Bacteroidales bacterium]
MEEEQRPRAFPAGVGGVGGAAGFSCLGVLKQSLRRAQGVGIVEAHLLNNPFSNRLPQRVPGRKPAQILAKRPQLGQLAALPPLQLLKMRGQALAGRSVVAVNRAPQFGYFRNLCALKVNFA